MPLGAIPGGQNPPRKRSESRGNMTKALKTQTALKRKPEPKTRNAHHAQLEAKFGLVDVITLLYPHLEGEVAIGGESFPCPLPMHLASDPRKVTVTPGHKWDKPYWKCGAGCCKDKGNDTIDFIRSALGIPFKKAISLWARLAAVSPEKRRGVLKKHCPGLFTRGQAA
jgi:hypothetical protein